ncbi:hypothetical protein MMC30_003544 [Trapelia coarctata]|nr:hypothetical protein [Trapelia coarctata]
MLFSKIILALGWTAVVASADPPNNLYVRHLQNYARGLEAEIYARDVELSNRDAHPHPELVAGEVAAAMKRDVLQVLNARMPHVVCTDKACSYHTECSNWSKECQSCVNGKCSENSASTWSSSSSESGTSSSRSRSGSRGSRRQ